MMRNANYEEMDLIALPSSTLITEDNVSELNEKLKSIIAEKYDKELKTVEITRGSELEKNIRNSIMFAYRSKKSAHILSSLSF